MKAVITVVGTDRVGILATFSALCAEHNVNVEEVTQNILGGTFAMIMLVEASNCTIEYPAFVQLLQQRGAEQGMDVHVTRKELFDVMHHV